MSSLMDEISREIEAAPHLRAENARLREYAKASAIEVAELRTRVVIPLLAIDLREAGAMTRCYEFVKKIQMEAVHESE